MIIHTEHVRQPLVRPEQLRPAQLRPAQLRRGQLRRGQLRRGQRPEAPRATEPRQAQQWQPRVRRTAAWIGCACAALSFFGSLSGKARAQATNDGRQVAPTLEEIRIEGEIAMPQVVFITARDQFQYPDERHRSYVLWAADIAALAPVPSLVWVVGHERPSTLFPGESTLDDRIVPLPASLPESEGK